MNTYRVSGMICGHCAKAVTRSVEASPSVERALVDLSQGELTVEGGADEQAIRQAVAEAGYRVEGSHSPRTA